MNDMSGGVQSNQDRKGSTTQNMFMRSLVGAHVPGGFVWIMKCTGEEPVFAENNKVLPLREALDSLTRTDPRYKWQMKKEVVNLMPSSGIPDLLKSHIRKFIVETDLDDAVRQLLMLPEVKQNMARLGLKRSSMTLLVGPGPSYGSPSKIKVYLHNVTLQEALNALVKAHGRAIWEYRELRCKGTNEFLIDFPAR